MPQCARRPNPPPSPKNSFDIQPTEKEEFPQRGEIISPSHRSRAQTETITPNTHRARFTGLTLTHLHKCYGVPCSAVFRLVREMMTPPWALSAANPVHGEKHLPDEIMLRRPGHDELMVLYRYIYFQTQLLLLLLAQTRPLFETPF